MGHGRERRSAAATAPTSLGAYPSETSSAILVAFARAWSAKSCRAMLKPAEIMVPPPATSASMPALISVALVEISTRSVADEAKETTPKRAASMPRGYWLTCGWAWVKRLDFWLWLWLGLWLRLGLRLRLLPYLRDRR